MPRSLPFTPLRISSPSKKRPSRLTIPTTRRSRAGSNPAASISSSAEEDKVKFCKVNVDEQPNLASMFGIDSIPTLAVVQDRHTLTGMVGVHDKADIKAMLEKCKA